LVPKLVTLNDLERRNGHYIADSQCMCAVKIDIECGYLSNS